MVINLFFALEKLSVRKFPLNQAATISNALAVILQTALERSESVILFLSRIMFLLMSVVFAAPLATISRVEQQLADRQLLILFAMAALPPP
jgi:hypothetical protein